jgi:hypothetical protein
MQTGGIMELDTSGAVMASSRKQFNFRVEPWVQELLPLLCEVLTDQRGKTAYASDVIHAALKDMQRKHLPDWKPTVELGQKTAKKPKKKT